MDSKKLIDYLRLDPADGQIDCGFHGPLEGLRALPQVFRDRAEQAKEDPEDDRDSWLLLAKRLEAQLEDLKELADDSPATLELEFDSTQDLQYPLAAAQARPELEVAVTGMFLDDTQQILAAWYAPAGSADLTPGGLEAPDEVQDFLPWTAQQGKGPGSAVWRLPKAAQQWFSSAELPEEGT